MINIQYTPPQYIFTSSLPTSISITTDASALDIIVECDGNGVFTTTLYPYNREVILYDIRSIIEGYLLSNRLIHTRFVIFAESEDENANTPEREALYCRVDIPYNAASYYIQSFFFNTLSSYTIPFDAFQTLTLFALPNATIPGYIECAVLPEGSTTPILMRTAEDTLTTKSTLDYFAIDIFPARIKESLKVSGKLLSFTVHYGHLAKTFYVSYGKPYLTLLAMNEFGCPEYIHLTCVTKRKLDISRSTATCLGASTFYDDNTAYEYEVESAMLTLEQTDHLSILLLSQDISIISDRQSLPIIITDITSEISDADNATNALKFKYKYARHHIPKSLKYPQNIFDDPFHHTFD